MTTSEVAHRCMEDPAFAQVILDGDDHPEVRHALLGDIQEGSEVLGFFNPCPEPPGDQAHPPVDLPGDITATWTSLRFPRLRRLADS